MPKSTGLLNDQLVLEIGGHISGPIAAQELRLAGARVIKIETKHGDPARVYLPPAAFAQCNAGKESIVPQSPEEYMALLSVATVIIDNRSPEAKQRDKTLQTFLKNPHKTHPVIFCSIVGYDSKQFAKRLALDVSVQAETGMAVTNSAAPNMPLKVGFVPIDYTTGLHAAMTILSHLYALKHNMPIANADNKVIAIEVSMALVSAQLQSGQYLRVRSTGSERIREGNRDLFVAPFSFYQTKDAQQISIGIVNDMQFKLLCEQVLQQPALFITYSTNSKRIHNTELEQTLKKLFLTQDAEYWITSCLKHGVVCSKVNSITTSIATFGQGFFFQKTRDNLTIVKSPVRSSLFEPTIGTSPKLNEHKEKLRAHL